MLIFQLTDGDGVRIVQDGACHRLIIDCCSNNDGAVYRFEAEGRKSEATLSIEGKDVTLTCGADPAVTTSRPALTMTDRQTTSESFPHLSLFLICDI